MTEEEPKTKIDDAFLEELSEIDRANFICGKVDKFEFTDEQITSAIESLSTQYGLEGRYDLGGLIKGVNLARKTNYEKLERLVDDACNFILNETSGAEAAELLWQIGEYERSRQLYRVALSQVKLDKNFGYVVGIIIGLIATGGAYVLGSHTGSVEETDKVERAVISDEALSCMDDVHAEYRRKMADADDCFDLVGIDASIEALGIQGEAGEEYRAGMRACRDKGEEK